MTKRPSGPLLFRIALVSDTHVNEREDFSTSPYPANAEANPRARHVFSQINETAPAFTIHLGDMVNPVPELPTYAASAENFHRLAARLAAPLHLIPGNHDIGDKPVRWMPAGMVNAGHIALYRQHFGRDFYSFDHKDCHFVIINAPLINSGDPAEAEQKSWLETDLAEQSGRRSFLFTHYPLYISDRGEPESYDNIDEPGRGWLLGLIERYEPEAVFAAHVHNFWYDRIGGTEYYILPSTCFVRHDYSEMYRIEGGDQKGRNDAAKLGHVTLEIYEQGHIARYHRSYGATLAAGAGEAPPVAERPHTKASELTSVFVDMRHPWAEEMIVAPSGAVDEFRRKRARNDYPLMAMWEMGLRGLRVPLQDLTDPAVRRRMHILCDVGHLFHVYCYGMPDMAEIALLSQYGHLVAELELVVNWDDPAKIARDLQSVSLATSLPVVLSRVNRADAAKHAGGRFNHLISHGFGRSEIDELTAFLAAHPGVVSGVQFTIPRSSCPWEAAKLLGRFGTATACRPVLYVKSTEGSPAERFEDDAENASRVAESVLASVAHGVAIILDTFDDADRGYFTRNGLVDRRFNPRLPGQILSALCLTLSRDTWSAAPDGSVALVNSVGEKLGFAEAGKLPDGALQICPVSGRRLVSASSQTAAGPVLFLLQPQPSGALK